MITWPVFGVLIVHRRGKRGQQLPPEGGAHRTHCQRRRGADRAGQVHGARADLRGGRRLVVQANLGGPRAGDLLTREDQTRRPLDANQAGQRFGRPEAVMNTQPGEGLCPARPQLAGPHRQSLDFAYASCQHPMWIEKLNCLSNL